MQKPGKHLSAEEYLELETNSSSKHEYVDGEVFAMAGGTQAHSLLSTNICSVLKAQLKGSNCRVHGSDLLVRIDATNSFYYPGAMIDCGEYDRNSTFTKTPAVIFEVVSRSTAVSDRREKLVAYKRIPSLCAYVIVQQTRKQVRIYQRDEHDWTVQDIETSGNFRLSVCPGTEILIAMEEIYEGADLDDSPNLQVREDNEVNTW